MSSHSPFRAALSAAVLFATVGCSPTLQDGRFSCATSADCPAEFSCRADRLCYRGTSDGGPSIDAPASEGGVDAGPPRDAGDAGTPDASRPGCGPNCIQLMVLNADPFLVGSVDFNDMTGELVRVPIPAYGTTSAVREIQNIQIGGTLELFLPGTLTTTFPVEVPTENRYLLVLGPSAFTASVVLVESPPEGLHTDGYAYLRFIDMTADETEGLLVSGAGRDADAAMVRTTFQHGVITGELPYLPSGPNAVQIELGTAAGNLIAALPSDQITDVEGTYYVVVAGRVRDHLDTTGGLRFIPGLPGATASRSGRLVRFINTTGTDVTVCDGATPLVTLPMGALSDPRVPPGSGPWALTVRTGGECSTGLMQVVTVGTATGRTLVSIAGDLAGDWTAVSISEPMPVPGDFTLVLHNALSVSSTIEGATIPSLGTGSVRVAIPPGMIMASTPAGDRVFDWTAVERQQWAVLVQRDADYLVYAIDSPYTARWSLTPELGR